MSARATRGLVACAALLLAACSQEPQPTSPVVTRRCVVAGYELGAPVRSFALPHKLREISAIVAVDATTLACLQDEQGELFFFDVLTGVVTERAKFGAPGDYEGLTRVGSDYWVLRSDGRLLQVRRGGDGLAIERTVDVEASLHDFEGLAYDARDRVLVVAPKAVSKAVGEKDLRPLLAVDVTTGATATEPYATIDRDRVLEAAVRLGVTVPTRETRKGEKPVFHLRFAEVAVHPRTGELWLLSAVDRAVIVADRSGAVLGLHFFTVDELPQPEAATFLPGGDLVIASEGAGGAAVLRVYGPAR